MSRNKRSVDSAFKPGSGVRLLDWPGHKGRVGTSGKKHCPVCAACYATRCWNGSGEHEYCQRHYRMNAKMEQGL